MQRLKLLQPQHALSPCRKVLHRGAPHGAQTDHNDVKHAELEAFCAVAT